MSSTNISRFSLSSNSVELTSASITNSLLPFAPILNLVVISSIDIPFDANFSDTEASIPGLWKEKSEQVSRHHVNFTHNENDSGRVHYLSFPTQ